MSEQDIAASGAFTSGAFIIADVFRFALEAGCRQGEAPVAVFERLADQLGGGAVSFRLTGGVDAEGKPRLKLTVRGRLVLRCQRCLGEMSWDLVVDSALLPVRAGRALPEDELESDEADAIEVDGGLDVLSLVEDEIILALPIAPRHEDCGEARTSGENGGARRESPFAALVRLQGDGK
ncbi:MAG: DUF177 domain-containing protein [Azoarcus sp.]|jgi:uncharacterized protein|nr:DUF177 domain-containing protein [Azoarcus sp.]